MRPTIAVVLVLIAVARWPAGAAAGPAPTPDAPVVVAGLPVTLDAARKRAGSDAEEELVSAQLSSLVHARWVAGEAALRGVRARRARVAGLLARAQRAYGGPSGWRRFLARRGIPEAEARAQIEEQALREALVDAITSGAHGDARRWGGAMDAFNRRWRAATVCDASVEGPVRDVCGNLTPQRRCDWYALGDTGSFPLGTLCDYGREWSVLLDLIEQLYPRRVQADLACDPEGDAALDRVERYLRRTAARVLRNVFFDSDCDPQLIAAPYRSAMVTVLHGVARLAASARRER